VIFVGDVNGDFAVTDADISLLKGAVNGSIPNPSFLAEGDANHDGVITATTWLAPRRTRATPLPSGSSR